VIYERRKHILLWTIGLALAGGFLSLKGTDCSFFSAFLSRLPWTAVGAALGFGFGVTFAKPRSALERKLKVLYSAIIFGLIGAVVGSADPGFRSMMNGALIGIFVGCGIGIVIFLTLHVPPKQS